MRIWVLNCPNSAKTLKCTTLMIAAISLFCLVQLLISTKKDVSKSRIQTGVALLGNVNTIHSVCVGFLGRLGNQIFQFATAYGIAKQKGMKVRISQSDEIAQVFNLSGDIRIVRNKEHCGHAVRLYERYSSAYDPYMLEFATQTDVLLLEYLQSWRYFINVTEDLRLELTFKQTVLEWAQAILLNKTVDNKSSKKNSTYIGLHVPRGDMVIKEKSGNVTNWLYNVASREYLIHAMSYFLRKYRHVTFIVCSDGIRWVKQQLGKHANLLSMIFIEKNPPEVDLAILSLCNHTIMTTGTFSWWAAWLAGGDTVYFKNYIPETSPLRNQFNKDFSDYFLPHWIPME